MLVGHVLRSRGKEELSVFPSEQYNHDCSEFTVLTADNEMVCIRCGRVCEDEMREYLFEKGVAGEDGKRITINDHNAGNGLLNSETVQSGFVSLKNVGVAMSLNAPKGKDFSGKKIKPQLQDPYKAGLIADPSKGCHTEENVLTGKTSVKFSRYDLPTLQIIKERALKRCLEYGFDTVEQTVVAKELKRIYSHLFLGPMIDYAVLAGLLMNSQFLSKSEQMELEKELAHCIEDIRGKVLSGCSSKCKDRGIQQIAKG